LELLLPMFQNITRHTGKFFLLKRINIPPR
jgi:hypothetical protein